MRPLRGSLFAVMLNAWLLAAASRGDLFEFNFERPAFEIVDAAPSNFNRALVGGFDITVSFQGGLTPSQQAVFSQAEVFWENIITGYQPGITVMGVSIGVEAVPVDGVGGTLGFAGPVLGTIQNGFVLATDGAMSLDIADITELENQGLLDEVIAHEMAHVLGIGTLWHNNNLYVNGTGQYTGAAALAAFQTEFDQPGATFVPVELGGASGTADAHWNEVDGGAGPTGLTDPLGRDFQFELMTGWLNTSQAPFVSNTTAQSFVDMGFQVNAIPEPSALLMAGLVASGLVLVSWRKRGHRIGRK